MLRAIILACAIFVEAQGRIALFGCQDVTPKPSVFYPTMIGTWFEYGGYFDMDRVGTECTTYSISLFIDVVLTIETSVKDRDTGEITTNSTSYAIDQASQSGELEALEVMQKVGLVLHVVSNFYQVSDPGPSNSDVMVYCLSKGKFFTKQDLLVSLEELISYGFCNEVEMVSMKLALTQ